VIRWTWAAIGLIVHDVVVHLVPGL